MVWFRKQSFCSPLRDMDLRVSLSPALPPPFHPHLSFCLSKSWDSWKQSGRHAWKSCLSTWGDTVAVSSEEQQGDEDCCLMTHSGGQMLLVSPRWIIHDSKPRESLVSPLWQQMEEEEKFISAMARVLFLRRWCMSIFTPPRLLCSFLTVFQGKIWSFASLLVFL